MFKAANAICHCVYHDHVSVRKSSWNSKCFLLQTQNQFLFWASEHGCGLEGIFKTLWRKLKQDFMKLFCNSSVGVRWTSVFWANLSNSNHKAIDPCWSALAYQEMKHIHHWTFYTHEIDPLWNQTLLNVFISMKIILK